MILTVLRHGEAGDATTDRARRLTAKGREDAAKAGDVLVRWCQETAVDPVDRVDFSPWVRTTETAEAAGLAMPAVRRRSSDVLRPGSDVEAVMSALSSEFGRSSSVQHLLVVSHQPLVSCLIDHLLGERGLVPALPPGGFSSLSLEAPMAGAASLLCWSLPPLYEVCR